MINERAIVYRAPYKTWYPLRIHKGKTKTQETYDKANKKRDLISFLKSETSWDFFRYYSR